MNELQAFFSMGGYGTYIWSAYAITFVVLLFNFIVARKDLQRQLQHARQQQRRAERRATDNLTVQDSSTVS